MSERSPRETHPSYGMALFHRVTGSSGPMFGSALQHQETIQLTISRGSVRHDLNTDWYGAEEELIEVEFSPIQFAELITHMNMGSGVPCTIRRWDQQDQPKPPATDLHAQFQDDFQRNFDDIARLIRGVKERAQAAVDAKSQPGKKTMQDIIRELETVRSWMNSNFGFLAKCFQENMDRATAEGKAAIEAFALRTVMETGLATLRDRQVVALEPRTPPVERHTLVDVPCSFPITTDIVQFQDGPIEDAAGSDGPRPD